MRFWTIALIPGVLFMASLIISLSKSQPLIIFSYILWFLTYLFLMGVIYYFIRHVTTQINNLNFSKPSYKPFPIQIYEISVIDESLNHLIKKIESYETKQWHKTAQQAGKSLQMIFSSTVDGLTGVANRKYLDVRLEEMFSKEKFISVIMLDIDFFKRVNDTYGHLAGDEVLQQFAQIIIRTVREGDFVARYGGEEFTVITPNNLERSVIVAERIRKAVESTPLETSAGIINITVSIGVADKNKQDTVKTLLERADNCLYQAKKSGRNKVSKSYL